MSSDTSVQKSSGQAHWYRRGSETNNWQNNHPMFKIRPYKSRDSFPTLLRPEVWNRICYPQIEERV